MTIHFLPQTKTDRRVQRTEKLLSDAMIALILEKGYDAITVQDILDRANLGRSTFYAHYRDKDDLLMSGFETLLGMFESQFRQAAPPGADPSQVGRELSLFFFRHAGENHNLFKAMIGAQGGKVILARIQKSITGFLRDHLIAELPASKKNLPADAIAHYIASSYLSLLTWWLDHDLPCSAEEMDGLFQMLVFPGIRALVNE